MSARGHVRARALAFDSNALCNSRRRRRHVQTLRLSFCRVSGMLCT
jgi:hypothetical protein